MRYTLCLLSSVLCPGSGVLFYRQIVRLISQLFDYEVKTAPQRRSIGCGGVVCGEVMPDDNASLTQCGTRKACASP